MESYVDEDITDWDLVNESLSFSFCLLLFFCLLFSSSLLSDSDTETLAEHLFNEVKQRI